ncbi:hypothetical protein APHCRT_1551 [Anaplasma phagocytophilum str. CRT53-1]|uniref:Uncharacterized protein n=3 Tax=Anaplasma phagocytophilum TaxID=948 RepID=A0AA45ZHF5_ANAPH|nr:hypothetical protein APHWEB_0599 [Anaplasma phagocytophilum str. Webster]KJV63968.1 hypothetical protein APHMUC_1172 [Anaplasma phagocytophilum str. ApMUC09]KJV80218.1 hypothetical protein APHCRT_1551 [Anaplasma phagocytophilum str. CRT53-1]KJV82485.1 hypothetical protein APHHGE2_0150 [Anaplasma phagocytophilum str. HGE2]KJV86348.1 hypothetical protein APHNYW_1462 [Anaplasma phagocytophilum str. ApNYW]KJV99725.1 hypothetical protein OTSANNIE_0094 [Anaplasma phagocytophilum str. Annie]SBO14
MLKGSGQCERVSCEVGQVRNKAAVALSIRVALSTGFC